jgi:pyrimidine operon attenuation protein/uracil phosphoribosyltransferase
MPEGWVRERRVLDAGSMRAAIRRMAGEIVRGNRGLDELMLVGIRTRGVPLAEALADAIEASEGTRPSLGILDITLYRDDLSAIGPQPVLRDTRLGQSIDDRVLVLCDDVLFTGRTVRAALEALVDFGRPRRVQLAVLIDRGLRELPIQADFVGERIETTPDERVEVHFPSVDGDEKVEILVREA